jgi:hypothetical protein
MEWDTEIAQAAALEALGQLADEIELTLAVPVSKISDQLIQQYEQASKAIRKIQNRAVALLDKQLTGVSDGMEVPTTAVLQSLNLQQQQLDWLLQQAAVKVGWLGMGESLTPEKIAAFGQVPEQILGAQMVLQLGALSPLFKRLIEVLEEIRDRMPGLHVQVPEEEPSIEDIIDDRYGPKETFVIGKYPGIVE